MEGQHTYIAQYTAHLGLQVDRVIVNELRENERVRMGEGWQDGEREGKSE